jgi:hypothetical protein
MKSRISEKGVMQLCVGATMAGVAGAGIGVAGATMAAGSWAGAAFLGGLSGASAAVADQAGRMGVGMLYGESFERAFDANANVTEISIGAGLGIAGGVLARTLAPKGPQVQTLFEGDAIPNPVPTIQNQKFDAPSRGAGRGNQMVFADEAEEIVSSHTGVLLNRSGQTIPGSGPGGVRIPDLEVRGPNGSVRLRGSVIEIKASRYSNFGDMSARGRAQILDQVAYVRRLRGKASLVNDPGVRALLENAHVEVFSDLVAPTRGRFYRLIQQGLIKWRPIPR